jgi:RND family efflux transporter MFP subunit
MKKKLLLGIGIVFGSFLLWRIGVLIFSSGADQVQRGGLPTVAVEVDSIRFGQIIEIRQLTGTVYPLYQYVVAPKVSGRIKSIRKRIGDWVRAGEIIARIDDAEYHQGVVEAEANLKIAEASLTESQILFALARQEKERVESLQAKGISSASELDAAISNYSAQESRLQLARAQVEQREAALKSANIRQSYTVLTASKPGLVGVRFVDEGELLAPNAAVVTVIGIDSVLIRTTIIERDYGYLRTEQPAEVMVDAYPARRFVGRVARVAPMLQEASRVAQMEVEVGNDSLLLKPGMFARVEVVTAAKDSAQLVPSRAIANRISQSGVFMVAAGETVAHFFPVKIGIQTPLRTEILAPRLQGLVITLGQHLLEDGSPVLLPGKIAGKPESDKGKEARP